jgi:hypothetical protein
MRARIDAQLADDSRGRGVRSRAQDGAAFVLDQGILGLARLPLEREVPQSGWQRARPA